MQGLMWRSYDSMGFLTYSFSEVVQAMHPYYAVRALGGLLYLSGALIMVYNIAKTIGSGNATERVTAKTAAPIAEIGR
jgi:cytochrome c oxidase cbb3-type subunit I